MGWALSCSVSQLGDLPCPCSPAGRPPRAGTFSTGGTARPGTSESVEEGVRARIPILLTTSPYWDARTVHQAVTDYCCSLFPLHLIPIYTDFV